MAYEYRGGDEYHTREDFDQQESIREKGGVRTLVCFCIDVSESMTIILSGQDHKIDHSRDGVVRASDGQKMHAVYPKRGYTLDNRIGKLNEILEKMLRKMKNDPYLRDSVVVSIITFAEEADIKNSFMDVSIIDPSRYADLKVSNRAELTSTGQALKMALQELNYAQSRFGEWDIDMRKSTIVLLSDGEPTDTKQDRADTVTVGRRTFRNDAYSVADVIRDMVKENVINFVPVLIGDGNAEAHDFLTRLTPQQKYFRMSSEADYERVFELIGQDLGSRTTMQVQDEISDYVESVQVEARRKESVVDTNTTGTINMDFEETARWFSSGGSEKAEVFGFDDGDEDDEFSLR